MKNLKAQTCRLLLLAFALIGTLTVSSQNEQLVLLTADENDMKEIPAAYLLRSFLMGDMRTLKSNEYNMNLISFKDTLLLIKSESYLELPMDKYEIDEYPGTELLDSSIVSLWKNLEGEKDLSLELRSESGKVIEERTFKLEEDIFSDVLSQKQGVYTLVLKVEGEVYQRFTCVVSPSAKF